MPDQPIIEIGSNGAQFRVVGSIDPQTSMYLALAIFIGMTAALLVYSRIN